VASLDRRPEAVASVEIVVNRPFQLQIGSVFVLGQAAITQAVPLVKRMRAVAGEPAWIPADKEDSMVLESPVHVGTGLKRSSSSMP
jgi:hypothetical protein